MTGKQFSLDSHMDMFYGMETIHNKKNATSSDPSKIAPTVIEDPKKEEDSSRSNSIGKRNLNISKHE